MKLREFRREKGWTQVELAKKLNVCYSVVSKWELGMYSNTLEHNFKDVFPDDYPLLDIPRDDHAELMAIIAQKDNEIDELKKKIDILEKEKLTTLDKQSNDKQYNMLLNIENRCLEILNIMHNNNVQQKGVYNFYAHKIQ